MRPAKLGKLSRCDKARVAWCAEDVQELKPDWSAERCIQFLQDNEDDIQCAMIERGWDAIRDLIRHEEHNPKGGQR
jgi:hypothetical protein